MKIPLVGGTPTTLASQRLEPRAVTVDSNNVYWTEGVINGALMKLPLSGGTPITLASADVGGGIAVDSNSIYYVSPHGAVSSRAAT